MAFKMKGMSFIQGQSPMKKIGGKNYEKSKGDQQGPIPEQNVKLQKSEMDGTYVYGGGKDGVAEMKADEKRLNNRKHLKNKNAGTDFVESERINDLEERKSFIKEDEFNSGKSTNQQKKDKKTLEREAEIMRDRRKNKASKKTVPFKKHVKGHKSKEQLIKEGFTPADADRMIKDGATTGNQAVKLPKPDAKPKKRMMEKFTKIKKKKKPSQGDFVPAYEGADYSKEQIAKMTKAERKRKID